VGVALANDLDKVWTFNQDRPLIGFYGLETPSRVNRIGALIYNTTCALYPELIPVTLTPVEPKEVIVEQENNYVLEIVLSVVAIILIVVIVLNLLILLLVLIITVGIKCCCRCRRRKSNAGLNKVVMMDCDSDTPEQP